MKIEAVFFDLGKVLLNFDFRIAKQKIALKSDLDAEAIEREFFKNPDFYRYEVGEISTVEFFKSLADWLHFRGDIEELKDIFCDIFWAHETNIAIAERLAKQMPVYLVSNTNEIHIEHIEPRYTFLREFTYLFYSHKIRRRKPNPDFYEHVLQHSGRKAAHSLFVDDLKENVEGARLAGFHTIHILPDTDLKAELHHFGIKV